MSDMVDGDKPIGFDNVLGTQFIELSGDRVVATLAIEPHLLQPYGILHGGVHCSVIESVASVAGALWIGDEGQVVGSNNSTNFIRPTTEGVLTYTATPIQRGRTQQLWMVEARSEDGKLVAQGQVRLANIRKP